MSFLLTILILCLALNNLSEAKNGNKLPSAIVVGTVYCDTCFQMEFSKPTHFISGASVAVKCGGTSSSPNFYKEVKTDDHGEFKVSLPFSVTKHVKNIKKCSVKLISSNEPYCSVASTATSSSIHLKSRKKGIQIFSAGFFTFKPLKQPDICNQKPSFFKNSKKFNSFKPFLHPRPYESKFPLPIQDPPIPFLPPKDKHNFPSLPQFPQVPKKTKRSKTTKPIKSTQKLDQLPQPAFPIPLPPNPLQPPSLFPPNPFQPPPSIFPPNPFQPPPSIFPPNPFQPPPSSIFPPNPFQPPPSSIFPPNPFQPSPPPTPIINFPPIPFLTPSPPPPPPPFSFHFPPFPFQPAPGFPGIPPPIHV